MITSQISQIAPKLCWLMFNFADSAVYLHVECLTNCSNHMCLCFNLQSNVFLIERAYFSIYEYSTLGLYYPDLSHFDFLRKFCRLLNHSWIRRLYCDIISQFDIICPEDMALDIYGFRYITDDNLFFHDLSSVCLNSLYSSVSVA